MSEDTIDQRRRRLLQAVAASGISVGLAGCSGGQGTETEGQGEGTETTSGGEEFQAQGPGDKRYIVGTTSGAQSLNPLEVSDEATLNRLNLLYDGGSVTIDGNKFESRWLADYQLSDDFTSATYVLRDDLQWGADYGQVTADDYLSFTNNIVYGGPDDKTGAVGYTQRSSYLLGGEEIEYEKLGKLEFRANLPQSRGFWLQEDPLRTALIVPAGLIEKYKPLKKRKVNGKPANVVDQIGADPAVKNADLAGNLGPFSFESWEKGQKLVVTANDGYYLSGEKLNGAGTAGPNVDSVDYQVFDEQSTAYSAIKAGDITTTGVEGRKVKEISNSDGVKVFESKFGEGAFFISLNHRINGFPGIRNRAFRQGLQHLIDANVLVEQIFAGFGDTIGTFHERWGPFYPEELPTFEPSVQQAKQKFEAGTSSDYTYDGDTFIGPDGQQVELTLAIVNTQKSTRIQGNYIKQRLKEAGIKTKLTGTSFGKIIQNYLYNSVENNSSYSGKPSWSPSRFNGGAYDEAVSPQQWDIIAGVGFSGNPFTPWGTIKALLPADAPFNFMGYTPEKDIRKLTNDAATASSPEETQEVMNELFTFLARDQPLTWLYNPHTTIGYRKGVTNLPKPDSFWDKPDVRTIGLKTEQ